jgi:SOS-response transcriptional repressor LexA
LQVLVLTHHRIAETGQAPSYSEICDELGIATKGEVSEIVGRLERRGLLRRVGRGRVRRISLQA